MTPEKWQQIRDILHSALELKPPERSAFLDKACPDDGELRREVESLIAAHEEEEAFMETPVVADAAKLLRDESLLSMQGRLIGHYKIIQEIGRGGMGAVYLAVRADDEYKKRVAIKIVKRGMDSDYILSRFRHERQILASLDHPNIARLLDGGTTDDGLPYFVMEYIEGEPIDQYCDEKKLSTVERLKLFRQVCAAVQYAHQNLVVHRDIKPGNILVTADGVPKLLDFGIAKILNPELYGQTLVPTAVMHRLMTPDYASPEQVRGKNITTASDIYSLGVLLYELLTGHRPYRIGDSSPQELERMICEQEPEKPSNAVSGRWSVVSGTHPNADQKSNPQSAIRNPRLLRGDLDNIILMAMRKAPERRYASAEQFSEDIRRHLEGLPCLARKDNFAYRASKFAQRNKLAVVVATAFIILVISFIVVTIRQSIRANRERDKAERVAAFLVDLFQVSDPSQSKGNEIKAREILDQGAARIEKELASQPELQAELLETVGTVYRSLKLYDKAQALLEKSLQVRRGLFGEESLAVARSESDLGLTLQFNGNYAQAERLQRLSLATQRKLSSPPNKDLAQIINDLATTLHVESKDEEAEPLFHEALDMRRKLFGNEHKDVSLSLNNYGLFLSERGDYAAAEPIQREVVALDRKLYDGDDPEVALHLNNLGLTLYNKGDLAGAEQFYREALQMDRRLYGASSFGLTTPLSNLAGVLREELKFDEAEPLFREAVAIALKTVGKEHPNTAILMSNLAKMLYDKGDLAAAEALYREALPMYRKAFGDTHPAMAKILDNLAILLYDKGDYAAAEPMFRNALNIQQSKLPKEHKDTALSLVGLGKVLTARGKPQEAEPLLREGLEIRRQKLLKDNSAIGLAAIALGECLTALKRYDEAEALLMEGYENLKAKYGEHNKQTAQAAKLLATLYQSEGRADKAASYLTAIAQK